MEGKKERDKRSIRDFEPSSLDDVIPTYFFSLQKPNFSFLHLSPFFSLSLFPLYLYSILLEFLFPIPFLLCKSIISHPPIESLLQIGENDKWMGVDGKKIYFVQIFNVFSFQTSLQFSLTSFFGSEFLKRTRCETWKRTNSQEQKKNIFK